MDDSLKKLIDSENIHELNLFLNKNKKNVQKILTQKPAELQKTKHLAQTSIDVSLYKDIYYELPQAEIFIDKSKLHGYGVFSKNFIYKLSPIEICYAIELEFRDKYHKDQTILNYAYANPSHDTDTINHGNKLILLTGNGMLYNHDHNNNAEWRWMIEERKAVLIATKDIPANTEITINYGAGYWDRHNVHKS